MQITPPLILIALGSALMLTQRDSRLVLAALFVQWAGLAWQVLSLPVGGFGAAIEAITGVASITIMGLTVWGFRRAPAGTGAARGRPAAQSSLIDALWLWAVAVVVGVAGYGLASLYPLGTQPDRLLSVFWIVLPAMLTLVIAGARDSVKVGVALLALLNATTLLIYTLSLAAPTTVVLGSAALVRFGLAAVASYSWLLMRSALGDLSPATLFDLRSGLRRTETALVVVGPSPNTITETDAEQEQPEEEIPEDAPASDTVDPEPESPKQEIQSGPADDTPPPDTGTGGTPAQGRDARRRKRT
jgi:hypothetical protein